MAAAFAVAVFCGSYASAQVPPCDLMDVDDNTFCFPSGQADWQSTTGRRQSQVSITLVLPEYRPLTADDVARLEAPDGSSHHENVLKVVLVARHRMGVTWTWEQQIAEWRRLRVPIPDASVVPGNMRRLVFDPGSAEPKPWHSHFLVQIDGRDSIMKCGPFQPVPLCFLQVFFRGSPLGIWLPESKLALWAEVYGGVVRYLERHAR